jgi:hypothetical protein
MLHYSNRDSSPSTVPLCSVPDVDIFSKAYWTDGCYLQTQIMAQGEGDGNDLLTRQISPCFLSDTSLKQMMYTGKAIRIIQALMETEVLLPSRLFFELCSVVRGIFTLNSAFLDHRLPHGNGFCIQCLHEYLWYSFVGCSRSTHVKG